MMVVTLGALTAIPRELYEAAASTAPRAGSASATSRCRCSGRRSCPRSSSGGVWTFNMFNVVFLVSGGEPGRLDRHPRQRGLPLGLHAPGAVRLRRRVRALIFVLLAAYAVGAQRLLAGREAGT